MLNKPAGSPSKAPGPRTVETGQAGNSFLRRLKERKVIQTVAAFAGFAWIV
jgi:hypothetical protein